MPKSKNRIRKYSLKGALLELKADDPAIAGLAGKKLRVKLKDLGFPLPSSLTKSKLAKIAPSPTSFDEEDLEYLLNPENSLSPSRSKLGKMKNKARTGKKATKVFSKDDMEELEQFRKEFSAFGGEVDTSTEAGRASLSREDTGAGDRTNLPVNWGKHRFFLPQKGRIIGLTPGWDGVSKTGDTKLKDDLYSFAEKVYAVAGDPGNTGTLFEDLAQATFGVLNVNLVPVTGKNAPDAMYADGLGNGVFYSVKGSLTKKHGVSSSPVGLGPLLGLAILKQNKSGIKIGCISGGIPESPLQEQGRISFAKTSTTTCDWEEIPLVNGHGVEKLQRLFAVRLGGGAPMIWAYTGKEFVPAAVLFGSPVGAAADLGAKNDMVLELHYPAVKGAVDPKFTQKLSNLKRSEASMSEDYSIEIAGKKPVFMYNSMKTVFGGYAEEYELRLPPLADLSKGTSGLRQMARASEYDAVAAAKDPDYDKKFKTSEFSSTKERGRAEYAAVKSRRMQTKIDSLSQKDRSLLNKVISGLESGSLNQSQLMSLFSEHKIDGIEEILLEYAADNNLLNVVEVLTELRRYDRFMDWAITGKRK